MKKSTFSYSNLGLIAGKGLGIFRGRLMTLNAVGVFVKHSGYLKTNRNADKGT